MRRDGHVPPTEATPRVRLFWRMAPRRRQQAQCGVQRAAAGKSSPLCGGSLQTYPAAGRTSLVQALYGPSINAATPTPECCPFPPVAREMAREMGPMAREIGSDGL
eukprot:366271-Chlamydomonas_euryale.AAC.2